MKGLRCWCWMVCMVAGLSGGSAAHAASMRISFSGAVVEPTCNVGAADLTAASSGARHTCGSATVAGGSAPGAFRLTVARIEPGAPDRLLNYFAGYAGPADVRLVTQTYD